MKKTRKTYHHGSLAESLLDAVEELANKFGLEAVSLRACAKHVGVAPSAAFRHYSDKKSLLTAFATRALKQLAAALEAANATHNETGAAAVRCVGLAYIRYALEKPALFRAMWREETLYAADTDYQAAANQLSGYLASGFADSIPDDDPEELSNREFLLWAAVHGIATLYVDGPVLTNESLEKKLNQADKALFEIWKL